MVSVVYAEARLPVKQEVWVRLPSVTLNNVDTECAPGKQAASKTDSRVRILALLLDADVARLRKAPVL